MAHGKAGRAPRSAVGGRGTYAFFLARARALSPFFPFPPSFFPWFAGPPRGGRRRQVGEEGELPRRGERLRMEGHGWAPCPARGSAVSLEEGEGARSLRVRSYQR